MPRALWPLFRENLPLAKALPALAAATIQSQARARHGLQVGVIAILHTFNGRFISYKRYEFVNSITLRSLVQSQGG